MLFARINDIKNHTRLTHRNKKLKINGAQRRGSRLCGLLLFMARRSVLLNLANGLAPLLDRRRLGSGAAAAGSAADRLRPARS